MTPRSELAIHELVLFLLAERRPTTRAWLLAWAFCLAGRGVPLPWAFTVNRRARVESAAFDADLDALLAGGRLALADDMRLLLNAPPRHDVLAFELMPELRRLARVLPRADDRRLAIYVAVFAALMTNHGLDQATSFDRPRFFATLERNFDFDAAGLDRGRREHLLVVAELVWGELVLPRPGAAVRAA